MKISFLFSGTFWGVLLILFGLSSILKSFNINIPLARIFLGVIIIYVGIVMLFGGDIYTGKNNIVFNDTNIKVTENISDKYNIIFGSGVIDLTEISPEKFRTGIEVNTIFGASEILIDSSKPVILNISSVFGKATIPDGNNITFGDYRYVNVDEEKNQDVIEIEGSVVFGSMEIRNIEN